mgnify:CR=1 FL=1
MGVKEGAAVLLQCFHHRGGRNRSDGAPSLDRDLATFRVDRNSQTVSAEPPANC